MNVKKKNFLEVLWKYCDQAFSVVSSYRGQFERKKQDIKEREVVGRLMLCSLVSRYVELVGCTCTALLVVVDSV